MNKKIGKLPQILPNPTKFSQTVVWIGANAGGVSKTTLAVHIGYEMACRGFDTVLIDLDTNVSMNQFCGLDVTTQVEAGSV